MRNLISDLCHLGDLEGRDGIAAKAGLLAVGKRTFKNLHCRMRSLLVIGFILHFLLGPSAQGTLSIDQLRDTIENQHPSSFYLLAAKLFGAGKKDEAVFWFYAGQLRYRFYLLVNKDKLKPGGDEAVFASLSEEIGRPLNEYAFGNIPQLAKTIDAVLAWDHSHSNALTPPEKYRSEYNQIVTGLIQMRNEIVREADSIQRSRTAHGLENRS